VKYAAKTKAIATAAANEAAKVARIATEPSLPTERILAGGELVDVRAHADDPSLFLRVADARNLDPGGGIARVQPWILLFGDLAGLERQRLLHYFLDEKIAVGILRLPDEFAVPLATLRNDVVSLRVKDIHVTGEADLDPADFRLDRFIVGT